MQTGDKVARPNDNILLPKLDTDLALFIDLYAGKTISYPAGMYSGECLSLVKQWIGQNSYITPPPSGVKAAYGYWTRFPKPLSSAFTKIPVKNEMKSGDIIIWSKADYLLYGHIAIAISVFENAFISFDQNWLGYKKCQLVLHDYDGLAGYLRPKV